MHAVHTKTVIIGQLFINYVTYFVSKQVDEVKNKMGQINELSLVDREMKM